MALPDRCYVVAATPRSGSSLLCEGLAASGVVGRPAEVFAPTVRHLWRDYLGLSPDGSFADYFEAVTRYGTTDNGIYGMKIQWMHVHPLAKALGYHGNDDDMLDTVFHRPSYINIVRRDRCAQAISWFRAIQSDEWWRFRGAPATPAKELALDVAAIRELELEIERQQSAWQRYFEQRNIRECRVEYEVLEEDYEGQVARVLSFLGQDPAAARGLPQPRLMRQSDEVSARWRGLLQPAAARPEAEP